MTTMSSRTILGVDIGTSSVKASVISVRPDGTYEICSSAKHGYEPSRVRPADIPPSYSQQKVEVIFEAIDTVLSQLASLKPIELIALCGQMHCCVLWNQELMWRDQSNYQLNYEAFSDNYDWTDGRCDDEFLKTLPVPVSYHDRINSGYGTATLFWLARKHPQYLARFNRSTTIMDLFASVLCHLDQVFISDHNANNWGYFDPLQCKWELETLRKADFPVHLLPKPVRFNTFVGHTKSKWHLITPGIPVLVPFGDFQAAHHLAFQQDPSAIVINMGTSAQMCRLMVDGFNPSRKSTSPMPSVDYFPYLPGKFLAVAPSLNGGNVLRAYIGFLQKIVQQLTGSELTEAQVWTRLCQLDSEEPGQSDSNLTIRPTLFGERHDTKTFASVENISFVPPTLTQMTHALCTGLLSNLFDMMPDVEPLVDSTHRMHLICTGSVIARNVYLQRALNKLLQAKFDQKHLTVQIDYLEQSDADVGGAVLAHSLYFKNDDNNS